MNITDKKRGWMGSLILVLMLGAFSILLIQIAVKYGGPPQTERIEACR